MNLKISISKMFENIFSLPHTAHLHACGGEATEDRDDHEISSFLVSNSYQNMNFDQIKTGYKSDDYLPHFSLKIVIFLRPM